MAKKTAFTALSQTAIDATIKSIGTRANTLRNDVQKASASIMLNLKANGDYPTATRQMNALFKAMGNGMRSKALLAHFELHAPVVWNKETKELVRGHTAASPVKAHADINSEAVLANKWDEAIQEPEYKPIGDFGAAIAQLIKKADADIEKLGDKSKVDRAQLAALRAMVAK